MRVLVVKTSSMGDVIHTLPAVTDAARALPALGVDWVVEEGFAEIPAWHPAVSRVIPFGLRRWRKAPLAALRDGSPGRFWSALRAVSYDRVIDAQGLLKSALLVTRPARGLRVGLDAASAREPLAARFYDRTVAVPKGLHAVERTRRLFAAALGYPVSAGRGDYGVFSTLPRGGPSANLLFLHGTSRPDKEWPEAHWARLAERAAAAGFRIGLPSGSAAERRRAERLAAGNDAVEALPPLGLTALAQRLAAAAAVVSVDTGLSHLAAALGVPNVALFGPTDPGLVGGYGERQVVLRAADAPGSERASRPDAMANLAPDAVWERLLRLLEEETPAGSGRS